MADHCPIFLEAASSSDTCSTCTPSPECSASRRHTWSQSSRGQGYLSPCAPKSSLDPTHSCPEPQLGQDKTSPYSSKTQNAFSNLLSTPNQTNCGKNPTCQTLISFTPEESHANTEPQSLYQSQTHTSYDPIFSHTHTPPTLLLTTDAHHPNLLVSLSPPTTVQTEHKFPQHRAADAASSGFFHGSFKAPLSTLSCLLSLAASGLQLQDSAGPNGKQSQSQHSESLILSDRPPTEFCLSPDTSYESMSISHLQRRGETNGWLTTVWVKHTVYTIHSIQFSLFCLAKYHKLKICLRGLYNWIEIWMQGNCDLVTAMTGYLLDWIVDPVMSCKEQQYKLTAVAAPSIPWRGFLSNMTYF